MFIHERNTYLHENKINKEHFFNYELGITLDSDDQTGILLI